MKKCKKNRIVDKKRIKKIIDFDNLKVKDFFNNIKIIQEKHHNPKKYSEIFYEFIEPAIETFIDEEMPLQRILDWGQEIWNNAVAEDFPDHPKSNDIKIYFASFLIAHRDSRLIPLYYIEKEKYLVTKNFL